MEIFKPWLEVSTVGIHSVGRSPFGTVSILSNGADGVLGFYFEGVFTPHPNGSFTSGNPITLDVGVSRVLAVNITSGAGTISVTNVGEGGQGITETSLSVIPAATAATYMSNTVIGMGIGEVNPVDWIIETATSDMATKVTVNGGFDHFQDDDEITITFPDGTFSSVISMIAAREEGSHTSPVNFAARTGDPNVYTINRNDAIDGDHGLSFCIVGTR